MSLARFSRALLFFFAVAATSPFLPVGTLPAQEPTTKPGEKATSQPASQQAADAAGQRGAKVEGEAGAKVEGEAGATVEAPPPRELTPQERLASLQVTLDKVNSEKKQLQDIENSGGLVPRLLEQLKRRNVRGDDAVPLGPAVPKPKLARLLGDAEKKTLDEDVIFTVDSLPVTQKDFDALYGYLRSYPRPETAAAIKSETILNLVKAKAAEAAGKDNVARALAAITKVRAQLEAGASFEALAREHSHDEATAANGGDLGYLTRQYADKLCAQALFAMNPSEVSNVVRGTDGFHILRVRGAKKGPTADQDRVRASHILVLYTTDEATLKEVQQRIASANVDLAFRDKELREFVPEQFK